MASFTGTKVTRGISISRKTTRIPGQEQSVPHPPPPLSPQTNLRGVLSNLVNTSIARSPFCNHETCLSGFS